MPCCSCTWSGCSCRCSNSSISNSNCCKASTNRSKQKRIVAFSSSKLSKTRIENTHSPIAATLSHKEDNSIPVISITAAAVTVSPINASTTQNSVPSNPNAASSQINWAPPFAELPSSSISSLLALPTSAPKSPEMTRDPKLILNTSNTANHANITKANFSNEHLSSDSPISTANMLTTKLTSATSQTAASSQEHLTKPQHRNSHSNSTTPRLISSSTPTYSSTASGTFIGSTSNSSNSAQNNSSRDDRKFTFSQTGIQAAQMAFPRKSTSQRRSPIAALVTTATVKEGLNSNRNTSVGASSVMNMTLPNTADLTLEDPEDIASFALQSPTINNDDRRAYLVAERQKTNRSARGENDLDLLKQQISNVKATIYSTSGNAAGSSIDSHLTFAQTLQANPLKAPVNPAASAATSVAIFANPTATADATAIANTTTTIVNTTTAADTTNIALTAATASAMVSRSSGSILVEPPVNQDLASTEPRKSPKRSTVVIFSANTQTSSPMIMPANKNPSTSLGNKSPIRRGTAAKAAANPPSLQLTDHESVSIDIKL